MTDERDGMTPHGEDEELGLLYEDLVVADLRTVFERPAAPEVAARHLAAMQAAARDLLPPVSAEAVEAPFWTLPRRIGAAVAAVFVALFGLGGLGMAGALPDPVQDLVSTVAEKVGIDVPTADEKHDQGGDPAGSGRDQREGTGPTAGAGSSGEAPGQTGDTPGQSGQTPGQSGETPADGAPPPGQTGATPGQSGQNPSATAPGQTGESPSATAPGQGGQNPSATAPGQVGGNPSATAPGQQKGNPSATAPGQVGGNPSATAPGQQKGNPSATAPGQSGANPSETAPGQTGQKSSNGKGQTTTP